MARKYTPESKYQLMSHIAVLLFLLILFVSVGYFFLLGRPDEYAAQLEMREELTTGQALWTSRRPQAYRYVVDRSCNCPDEIDKAYVVTVNETRRDAAFPIPVESSTGIMLSVPADPIWIDDAFALIGSTLDNDSPVDVQYNYLYGYPEWADINPGHQSGGAIDRVEIRDFEVLRTE